VREAIDERGGEAEAERPKVRDEVSELELW